MAWLRALFCMLLLAAGGPAAAETLAIVRQAAESGVLIDLDTVRATGTSGRVRTIAFARSPGGGPPVFADTEQEYDCTQMRVRTRQVRLLDERGVQVSQINDDFGTWQTFTSASPNATTWAVVCRGQLTTSLQRVATLAAFSARYQAPPVQAAQPRSAQPAPAMPSPALPPPVLPGPALPPPTATASAAPRPVASSPAASSPAASGPNYVFNDDTNNAQSERLYDLSSRRRTGSVVSITNLRLLLKPLPGGSDLIRWMEETNEVDCASHRYRSRLDGVRSLDLKDRSPMTGLTFGDWSAAEPGGVPRENEDLFCRDQRTANHKNVPDLRAFQRSYYAEKGEKEPTSPEEVFASVRSMLRWYQYSDPAQSTANIYDSQSKQKSGAIATVNQLLLMREAFIYNGVSYNWAESAMEFDCSAHTFRQSTRFLLQRGRTGRIASPQANFGPWRTTSIDRFFLALEGQLCNRTPSSTFQWIEDLDAFERSFLQGAAR